MSTWPSTLRRGSRRHAGREPRAGRGWKLRGTAAMQWTSQARTARRRAGAEHAHRATVALPQLRTELESSKSAALSTPLDLLLARTPRTAS